MESETEAESKPYELKLTLNGIHTSDICTLTPLPNNHLASAGGDKTIQLTDLSTQKTASSLKGHTNTILCSTLLQNGRLATGSVDGTIKIWDLEAGKLEKTIDTNSCVRCMVVIDNGDLVVGSEDSTVKFYAEKDLSYKKALKGHKLAYKCLPDFLNIFFIFYFKFINRIYDMAVIPKGLPDLVTASVDNRIIIWNSRTGIEVQEIKKHSNWVRSVHVLKTGNIVSSSFDRSICVWDSKSKGNCLRKIEHFTPILTCDFSDLSGKRFASATGKKINCYSNETFELEGTLAGHNGNIWLD